MDKHDDYYEVLQVSASAEPDTIHRVYRLLAQRLHPDNAETGNAERFRALTEAYRVLGDPALRAEYDVVHAQRRQERWRLVAANASTENDFEAEQLIRLTVLELLYTRRRTERENPALSLLDLETLIGRPREHLEFTIWFLSQKKYVSRADNAMLTITVDGVEYFEEHFREAAHRRQLTAGTVTAV